MYLIQVLIADDDQPSRAFRFCKGTSWSAAQDIADLLKA